MPELPTEVPGGLYEGGGGGEPTIAVYDVMCIYTKCVLCQERERDCSAMCIDEAYMEERERERESVQVRRVYKRGNSVQRERERGGGRERERERERERTQQVCTALTPFHIKNRA
jgi:hypothetical protein